MGALRAGVSALAKIRPAPPERKTSKFALKYAHYVGGGTAATCALATGVGIFSETAATNGPLGLLMATVSGLVLGGGLGATWFYLHDVASHAKPNEAEKKALASVLAVGCVAIGIGTSGAFLARTISGASALQAYETSYVEKLQTSIDTVAANAADEEGLIAAVERGGQSLHATGRSEDQAGLVSNKRNKGPIYRSLNDAGDSLAAAAVKLQGIADERDAQLTEAKRELDDATHAIAARDNEKFESAAARAEDKVSAAAKTHLGTTAATLSAGVTASEARASIDAELGQIGKVARFVAEDRRAVAIPVYRRISETQATIEEPQMVGWSAAALLEMLPLLMFCVLLLLPREERDDDSEAASAPVTELRPRPSLVAAE